MEKIFKELFLLGLLAEQPMYGQQVREVIERHHAAFAPYIKKPTMYYQLDRMVNEGLLEVRNESVEAPGSGLASQDIELRERDVYYLTEAGYLRFQELLREALQSYVPGPSTIDAAIFFLDMLPAREATALLQKRCEQLTDVRARYEEAFSAQHGQDRAHRIVTDHACALLDAEIAWLQRTIDSLLQPESRLHSQS